MRSPADILIGTSTGTGFSCSREAEMALLGGLISYPEQILEMPDGVEADLHDPRHRCVFSALKSMWDAKEEIDAVKLKARLELSGRLEDAGGAGYIMELLDGCGRPQAAAEYAAIVSDFARRRTAQSAAKRYLDALGRGEDADAEAETLKKAMERAGDAPASDAGGPRMITEVRVEAEALRALPRIPTSIPGLDDAIGGGYLPRWTVIFGAFSGGGKTMLAVREAIHHASQGRPVLIISLELSAPEMVFRLDGALETPGIELPIWLWSETVDLEVIAKTIRQWATSIRAMRPDIPTPVVILDYIQLVQAPKQQTREREVAVAVQTLQRLARKHKLILIAGAQFNRASQTEERPHLHHLRESGQIEQSADLALLCAKDGETKLWIQVGKSRWSGAGAEFELSCDFAKCSLGSLSDSARFAELVEAVVKYLKIRGGTDTMRNVRNGIKLNGKHPSAYDIYDAAMTTTVFTAHGSTVKIS